MQLTSIKLASIATLAILISLIASAVATGQSERGTATSTTEQIRVVNVEQKGAPPTGPYPVVIEHDQHLATHTVYRPATLGTSKHSVVVWGEGACVKNGRVGS